MKEIWFMKMEFKDVNWDIVSDMMTRKTQVWELDIEYLKAMVEHNEKRGIKTIDISFSK